MAAFNANKTHCKNGHPFDADNVRIRARGGRDCRACAVERGRDPEFRARKRAYAKAYRDRYRARPEWKRKRYFWTVKSTYGLTREEWLAIFEAQGDRCARCRSPHPGASWWHVDHDHSSGEVRGILCAKCNQVLGLLGDAREAVATALDSYLDYLDRGPLLVAARTGRKP